MRSGKLTGHWRSFASRELPLSEEAADQAIVAVSTCVDARRVVVCGGCLGCMTITAIVVAAMTASVSAGGRHSGGPCRALAAQRTRAVAIEQVQALPQQGHRREQRQS
jgi:hypothetical protein